MPKNFDIIVENGTLFDGRIFTLYYCIKSDMYDIRFEAASKGVK